MLADCKLLLILMGRYKIAAHAADLAKVSAREPVSQTPASPWQHDNASHSVVATTVCKPCC